MSNTYVQLPGQLDWDYAEGDDVSIALTIATEPSASIDLAAEPVTAGVYGSSQPFTIDVVEPNQVRITPPALPVGQYGWWARWRGRTLLSREMNVRRRDSPGPSTLEEFIISVEYVDYAVNVTIQNGGIPGPQGEGGGVPDGGTTGQALVKESGTDGDADWANVANSVNGQTGVVVLDFGDVGADEAGAASAAIGSHVAAPDPHPQYLTEADAATTYAPIAAAVPDGGTTGQVLTKDSGTDLDASWQTPTGGGGTITELVAGDGIDIDDTNPAEPIISAIPSLIPFDAGGNASAARPAVPSTVVVLWTNTPSEPVNIGPFDMWEDFS